MRLTFRGHDDRYAIEQSLLAFFPDERPVYEGEKGDSHAEVTLREGKTYAVGVTELTYGGKTARGEARVRVAGVSDEYEVVYIQGGASMQFCMIPYNFLKTKAAYLDTGVWASKAIKEAKLFGDVNVVASSKDANYTFVPKGYTVPDDVDYFHITTNNTIYGTELREDPDVKVPLIADMSSDIFSRRIDVSKYDAIYAGAQKNLAPSGVTLVIVKEDALGKMDRVIPTMLDYRTHVSKGSMFNTPPCLPIYSALQTLKWYKSLGGIDAMEKADKEKAARLYDAIDNSKIFVGTAKPEDRSIMNVCFVLRPEYAELDKKFLEFTGERGIVGIKGHRSVGGFRASIYNAMPMESVQVLIDAMKDFEKQL